MATAPTLVASTIAIRLGATLFFVLLNGFFVAAEFALVKVRRSRIEALADAGNSSARIAKSIVDRLDLYLSACQFGITVSSLILGWLAEPAIAHLLVAVAAAAGWPVAQTGLLHVVSLAIALTIVTTLHMTLGEQAPKIWAIQRSEPTSLIVARPLRLFTMVFRPLIWVINQISNWMLRVVGISASEQHEATFSAEELRAILASSARAGAISARQRQFAENILSFVNLQVRHILVPRLEVVWLSTRRAIDENLAIIRDSSHSRFPLCDEDLDSVAGIVHAKTVMAALTTGQPLDLSAIARPAVFVPDTQPLGRMIVELQSARAKSAIVLDDHGTAIGMAFLEDALEEIVGPIQDEFDVEGSGPEIGRPATDVLELPGDLPLPEAVELLGLVEGAGADDTIGGHVVSLLKRLPEVGDQIALGPHLVTVIEVAQRRVERLRVEPRPTDGDEADR
jgi:CBS domain containing-hemolysin-like protein